MKQKIEDQFEVLRKINIRSNITQRELANDLGFSLGKLNYCLRELKNKGLIKIENFKRNPNKINYIYILTPKGQIISFGVIPQILPAFVANNLYILDRNVRMATMLGIVGVGGIGYELQSSFRMFEYERVSAIIILIFVTIFIIDHLSAFIRSKIK